MSLEIWAVTPSYAEAKTASEDLGIKCDACMQRIWIEIPPCSKERAVAFVKYAHHRGWAVYVGRHNWPHNVEERRMSSILLEDVQRLQDPSNMLGKDAQGVLLQSFFEAQEKIYYICSEMEEQIRRNREVPEWAVGRFSSLLRLLNDSWNEKVKAEYVCLQEKSEECSELRKQLRNSEMRCSSLDEQLLISTNRLAEVKRQRNAASRKLKKVKKLASNR